MFQVVNLFNSVEGGFVAVIHAVAHKIHCLLLHLLAVCSGKREEIELKTDSDFLYASVFLQCWQAGILFVVVKQRVISFLADFPQRALKIHGSVECGGLHLQHVVPIPDREEFSGFETLMEKIVDYALGGKAYDDLSTVGRHEALVAVFERVNGVWHILHDVGSEPHLTDSHPLVFVQYGECGVHLSDAVVNSRPFMVSKIKNVFI